MGPSMRSPSWTSAVDPDGDVTASGLAAGKLTSTLADIGTPTRNLADAMPALRGKVEGKCRQTSRATSIARRVPQAQGCPTFTALYRTDEPARFSAA